jgi:hypothetical protein
MPSFDIRTALLIISFAYLFLPVFGWIVLEGLRSRVITMWKLL